jgi:hypothetical protein
MEETQTAQPDAAEAFEFVDPKSRRTITLPRKVGEVDVKTLIEGVIEKSNTNAKNQYKAQIEELTAKLGDYEDAKQRLSELETNGMSAAEKSKKDLERFQKEAERNKGEAERLRQNLYSEKVGNAVFKELGQIKDLVDINKAEKLFNIECKPKLVESNGEFSVVAEYDGQALSLSEARAKWIARDDNKFLLKNTLNPGGGSAGGQSQPGTKTMKRNDFSAMNPRQQMEFINQGGDVIE